LIFSSAGFVFLFLPISVVVYFALTRARKTVLARLWLAVASLVFYGMWRVDYVPLLLASIAFNFWAGTRLTSAGLYGTRHGRWLLGAAIAINLAVLGYFKYAAFGAQILSGLSGAAFAVGDIALPLGISFFTFTQVAFLVDCYRGRVKEADPLNYALFVTFFPHLIAGPILHHSEMMPQFASRWTTRPRYRNILFGLCLFGLGLFKKVIIADSFARWSNYGFDGSHGLDFFSAWATALSYTFQIYFDFSGYSDMALGIAMLFNIRLPVNFNSPYMALSIQDFWRRWHMTLSRYLRDYLYIPLGGNRAGEVRTYLNLLITFTLGGLWHGASWMFVTWGVLHGLAMAINRLWQRFNRPLPVPLAWTLTFLFVVVTWVFFRARDWDAARRVLAGMVDVRSIWRLPLTDIGVPELAWGGWLVDALMVVMPRGLAINLPVYLALAAAFIVISRPNSMQITASAVARRQPWLIAALFAVALIAVTTTTSTVFLYFNF
jgi:alginate O-acetyltransferase complex protein AlgI